MSYSQVVEGGWAEVGRGVGAPDEDGVAHNQHTGGNSSRVQVCGTGVCIACVLTRLGPAWVQSSAVT